MSKERPLSFNHVMAAAILEGRKEQTRRPVKGLEYHGCLTGDCPHDHKGKCAAALQPECPYGDKGDLLWVREPFWEQSDAGLFYRADQVAIPKVTVLPWRGAGDMPREFSRMNLMVKMCWAENLQDITEQDAKKEGVRPLDHVSPEQRIAGDRLHRIRTQLTHPYTLAFAAAWDGIYACYAGLSWADNPWVWVVEFRLLKEGESYARSV